MEDTRTKGERLRDGLWVSLECSGEALAKEAEGLERRAWMPALFALYASSAEGLLALKEEEIQQLWDSYDDRVEALIQGGQLAREDAEEMEETLQATADAITDSCTMLLGRGGENNPLSAVLKGAAKAMELDYDLLTRTAGTNLAAFLSGGKNLR